MKNKTITVFWFRRDLRLNDNKALYNALKNNSAILPLFIFDVNILSELDKNDKRAIFIYKELLSIKNQLRAINSDLLIKVGDPVKIFSELINYYDIKDVYSNKDHEPYGINRDHEICLLLKTNSIGFNQYLDHLIFDKGKVVKADGKHYSVFTAFKNNFKKILTDNKLKEYTSNELKENFLKLSGSFDVPAIENMGFNNSTFVFPKRLLDISIIKDYDKTRNLPYIDGTSKLGLHLRFGTISIRKLMKEAIELNDVFLDELIWREFFAHILMYRPDVVYESYKKQYDRILWINNESDFNLWKLGKTGYPFVDAGMRQLNKIGFMHNRVRMVAASFLCKHLLIDWRWGEAYFAKKLLDYELSSNNGNWQWCAGSGSDAAPYFRVFNPIIQQEKFDKNFEYIKKWIPELESDKYPKVMIEHKFAVDRCKKVYKNGIS